MNIEKKKMRTMAIQKKIVVFIALLISIDVSVLAADTSFPNVSSPATSTQLQRNNPSVVSMSNLPKVENNDNTHQDRQAVIDRLLKQAHGTNPNLTNQVNQVNSSNQLNQADLDNSSLKKESLGLSDQAFSNTIRNMIPLSPDQIRILRYLFDQSQQAAAASPGVPPKPTSTSVIVNLSPGATPPIIRLSSGFVTSLVFLDSTGAPWPIQAYDLGDPTSFNIQWNKEDSTLLVQAKTHYKSGNLAVILKGLNTPVMLTLMPGQRAVDYRVDLRVSGMGPNANPVLGGLPSSESPELLDVLNGVPPIGSKPLIISGGDCQGWLIKGRIYLRTRLIVLSPAWISTISSADGTHAYELETTPVILGSQRGKLVKLMIEGL